MLSTKSEKIDTFVAPACHEEIEILFQDESVLLINKPSGLLSLSGKNPLNLDSVHHRLVKDFPTATMVHRLDFGTSGIMLLALNKSVNGDLTRQFQQRKVGKTYMSMLYGHLDNDQGFIDVPIAKDKPNFPLQKICAESGKPALTHYRVIERLLNPPRTRVLFTPETGRTHQLRVHSQQIGHPVLGCDLYGTKETHGMASRLLLHALTLEFEHPLAGKRISFECPSPF